MRIRGLDFKNRVCLNLYHCDLLSFRIVWFGYFALRTQYDGVFWWLFGLISQCYAFPRNDRLLAF